MALFQNEGQKGWFTLALGIMGGLAIGLFTGGKLIPGGDAEEEGEAEEGPGEAVTGEETQDMSELDEITQQSRPGRVSLVRRVFYLAFQGSEFKLYTHGYRCSLDFFDTRYFTYMDDGTTENGVQWFKFRAKKGAVTESGEIRFKLAGSRFNKLIYEVMVADTIDTSIPESDNFGE